MAVVNTFDQRIFGLILGLLGPLLGLAGYSFWYFPNRVMAAFIEIFKNIEGIQAPLLSLALIINILFFFISLQLLKWEKFAFGIIAATILYIPWVVYLKFSVE